MSGYQGYCAPVIITEQDLSDAIARLRDHGSDDSRIEVKRASGGLPHDLDPTLSAFANLPGGGSIILGLDEASGFMPLGLGAPAEIEAGVASKARNRLHPQVVVDTATYVVEGRPVVVVNVWPLEQHRRPARVGRNGPAYKRSADGDHQMNEAEVQQIYARRNRPRFDAATVPGSKRGDLDIDLVGDFLRSTRTVSRRLRDLSDEKILQVTSVTGSGADELTLAGLYAMGFYPQQFRPSLSITAVLESADPDVRNADRRVFDGPLPALLDDAVDWVRANTRRRIRQSGGTVHNEQELPAIAVRELVANALVHRDLSPHTDGKDVQLHLTADQLIIHNPGGLWGISVDQLGATHSRSAVNEHLYDFAQRLSTPSGTRVVEGEGGGIRAALSALRRAGMKPPVFWDDGVSFTVRVPREGLISHEDVEWVGSLDQAPDLTEIQRQLLVSMRHGETWTNQQVREAFGPIDSTEVRQQLQWLVYMGLAQAHGERGSTTYHLAGPQDSGNKRMRVPVARDEPLPGPWTSPDEGADHPGRATEEVTVHGPEILSAIDHGADTVALLADRTSLPVKQVRYALTRLRRAGLVTLVGAQGSRHSRYARA